MAAATTSSPKTRPRPEGFVRGDDERGSVVAARRRVGRTGSRLRFEGDVSTSSTDKQGVAPRRRVVRDFRCGGSARRRPTGAVDERRVGAGRTSRLPRPVARWVYGPGGPSRSTSLAVDETSVRDGRSGRFEAAGRGRSSNSSNGLARRKPGGADCGFAAVGLARRDLAWQAGDRNSSWVQDSARARSARRSTASRKRWVLSAPGQDTRVRR